MCFRATRHTFHPRLKKIKKIYPEKISYISGNENHKKVSYISETIPFSPPQEIFLYFKKQKPPKNPYTLGNGTFLYFEKNNFRTLAYLEPRQTSTMESFVKK